MTQAPFFSTQLNGPTEIIEGQSAHYECRIEPYPDSNLKVEWFHDGKPLTTGHRFRTAYDFGFASLDILTAYAEDSGTYTCKATNLIGQAQSSVQTSVRCKLLSINCQSYHNSFVSLQQEPQLSVTLNMKELYRRFNTWKTTPSTRKSPETMRSSWKSLSLAVG